MLDEYLDRGESAKSADRPPFQTMLARINTERDVDFVIVHKVDRWARNREDDVLINMMIRKAGATLVSATENIDETPSGKFMHAIMAGMAEFYSANLATEVMKGTTQKAKGGGTPYMAPTGYINVRQTVDGREIRTVAVDPERAPLIQWAFKTYATGRYGTIELTEMLADRGLTSRPTGGRAAAPMVRSRVTAMLSNRYYLGFVTYLGVEYHGRHEPLVSEELFDRVQSILRAHDRAGDRQRKHHHYLKGSLRCRRCGSRMILTKARGQSGRRYPYFFCAGRQRRNGCDQPYVPVDELEAEVARQYRRVQLTEAEADQLRARVQRAVRENEKERAHSVQRERDRLARLESERAKLLQAHYAGAIPLDLLKTEQDRIARETIDARRALDAALTGYGDAERMVVRMLALLQDCHAVYRQAPASVRRLFNQAFFTQFDVDMRSVDGKVLTEAVEAVLRLRRQPGARGYQRPSAGVSFFGQGSSKDEVVEAPGIEPGSEAVSCATSTSVVPAFVSPIRRPGTGSVPASHGVRPARRRDATGQRGRWY